MVDAEEMFQYELIDIEFSTGYEVPDESCICLVCEDAPTCKDGETIIEYDSVGIPMGHSKEDTIIRRKIIFDHIQRWRSEHREKPRIFNEDLSEYIKINQVLMIESVEHAATNYKSTKAILQMDFIMTKAKKVALTTVKEGNRNQKPFQQMMVLRYSSEELGIVKFTVGVRKITKEKVAYTITVPSPEIPFIDDSIRIKEKVKSKKRKKRS